MRRNLLAILHSSHEDINVKICFGILSSSTNGEIISQLITTLPKESPIFIHHDFSQRPDFCCCSSENVSVLDDYVQTQWGGWSQANAIVRLLEWSLENSTYDYFQLLSETCLPIKKISEFESYLTSAKPDACIGLIEIKNKTDDLGTLNYAWRYFGKSKIVKRIVATLSQNLLAKSGVHSVSARILYQGLSIIKLGTSDNKLSTWFSKMLLNGVLKFIKYLHPFRPDFQCYVGSTWFCLSRATAQYVVNEIGNNPSLVKHYETTRSPDESIFHTIIGNAKGLKILNINHYISWKLRESGPDDLRIEHLGEIGASKGFFARKFSKSNSDALRLEVLKTVIPHTNAANA